jgi:hypothetical protein
LLGLDLVAATVAGAETFQHTHHQKFQVLQRRNWWGGKIPARAALQNLEFLVVSMLEIGAAALQRGGMSHLCKISILMGFVLRDLLKLLCFAHDFLCFSLLSSLHCCALRVYVFHAFLLLIDHGFSTSICST